MAFTCPDCGFSNEPGEKFCGGCGAALPSAGRSAGPDFASPEAYTPKHLAQKILTSRSALEGERKQVTVLFADIKGSLELIEGDDPEKAQALFDSTTGAMMEAVHRYEGTVNKVLGDGIMALFGAPIAHEDHAVRACYAALAMQEAARRNADEMRREHGVEVQVRIGINSGEVVVRAIGNDLTMDYDAIGQTTHLASRMEQMAIPGTARITGETLRLAEGFVQVKPLGPTPVKGLKHPVEVFELTGADLSATRLQAAVSRGLTRFVGRQAELETIARALAQAKDGQGQIVAVTGEPGVGKSRLFHEFAHSHRTEGWLILECGAVSYGATTPYLPVVQLLKKYFRIEDRDDVRSLREKVSGKVLTLDEELKPMLAPLLAFFDVRVEDAAWGTLDPPQRRRRTLEAIKSLLLRESRVQPVILVFEDLHWVDTETQAFLDGICDSLPAAPMLLLVNYRPEYQHAWATRTYYTQCRIDPLRPESTEELLATLLGEDAGIAPLKLKLTEQTGGNPFFLEESVRTLVESGVLAGEPGAYRLAGDVEAIVVPATVQGVLAARVDRLMVEDKRLLQMAAVIGKDVPYRLLAAIADGPEDDLQRGLADLRTAEFLYETRLFPDREYTFKHALTHEVVYRSILQDRRRALHRRIAEAIESVFADRLSEQVERLAHHYTEAGLADQAVDYWQEAGRRAVERSANVEAVGHLTKGLELIKRLPETPERAKRELGLHLTLGPALMAVKGFAAPEVEQAYLRARTLCRQVGEPAQLFTVTWGLWLNFQMRGQLKTAQGLADEVLALAEGQADPALRLQAHHAAWTTHYRLAEFSACREHTEQGFALYNIDEHRSHAFLYGGHDPGVCCQVHAATSLWFLGYANQALEQAHDAVTLAKRLSHPFSLAHARLFVAMVHQFRREAELAQERAEATIALCAEQGFAQLSAQGAVMRGWAVAARGQVEIGIGEMHRGLSALRATGAGAHRPYFLALLSEAYGHTGQAEEGLSPLAESLDLIETGNVRTWEAELHRLEGELLLARSAKNAAEAEGCFDQAIAVARRQLAKSLELRAATSLARLWQGQGKIAEADDLLSPVYGWFTEGFETADLRDAKALLDELS
ncbi:MAG: AAA family ATPase [Proteobacteria bacterium]|nr:AAA family ATPase [Pseudomonadota bacterium]